MSSKNRSQTKPWILFAMAGGLGFSGVASIVIGFFCGALFSASAFAATMPEDKKDPMHQMKSCGALAIGLCVGLSIGGPFVRFGGKLMGGASNLIDDAYISLERKKSSELSASKVKAEFSPQTDRNEIN